MPELPPCGVCGQKLDAIAEADFKKVLKYSRQWMLFFCCGNEACDELGQPVGTIEWPFGSDLACPRDFDALGFVTIQKG